MAKRTQELEAHPLVVYGKGRGWAYARTAKFFRIPYSTYRILVRGLCGISFERAEQCERRSKGEVRAIDLLRWHERNRRA
jgi:hypothetical protein